MTEVFLAGLGVQLPVRLIVEQVSVLPDTRTEEVCSQTSWHLLNPLGTSTPNDPKDYARIYFLKLADHEVWLARTSNALVTYQSEKNHGWKGQDRHTVVVAHNTNGYRWIPLIIVGVIGRYFGSKLVSTDVTSTYDSIISGFSLVYFPKAFLPVSFMSFYRGFDTAGAVEIRVVCGSFQGRFSCGRRS